MYRVAAEWFWRSHLPEGLVRHFSADGKITAKENYQDGVLQGESDFFWEIEGHSKHEVAAYEKGVAVKRTLFVDDQLVSESEFFPDGSLKTHHDYKKVSTKE
jgi:antitoxin component YwqK of YwqJK toxin-antitoxin module